MMVSVMRMDCIFNTKKTTPILKPVDSNTYARILTLYLYMYMLYMYVSCMIALCVGKLVWKYGWIVSDKYGFNMF